MKAADIHFLVVEDHDFQRELLVCMLAAIGATHIVEAADGCAALEVLRGRTRPIDVIISDLEMPAMDGMEFIRHVGEAGLPVAMILISAHGRSLLASVGTMTEAYGIDLLGAIEKPVTDGHGRSRLSPAGHSHPSRRGNAPTRSLLHAQAAA